MPPSSLALEGAPSQQMRNYSDLPGLMGSIERAPTARVSQPAQPEGLLDWLGNNIANPIVNGALIEPYNALAATVRLAERPTLPVRPAEFLSGGWFFQTVSGAIGSLLPYVVAGKFAGAGMRNAGECFGIRNRLAVAALRSERFAQVLGAGAYDLARTPHEGESRGWNSLAGMSAFGIFECGNAASNYLPGAERILVRALTGFYGAQVQHRIARGRPDEQEFWEAGLSGTVLNLALPGLQRGAGAAIDRFNLAIRRGIPLDRFVATRLEPGILAQYPELAATRARTWTRVIDGATSNSALLDRNKVSLQSDGDAQTRARRLRHELDHLESARAPEYEQGFQGAAQLLGNERCYEAYRQVRLAQELDVRVRDGVTDRAELAGRLAEMEAAPGRTYEDVWRSEFVEFERTRGRFRPTRDYGGDAEFEVQRGGALEVTRNLQEDGYFAGWAGGCVRDELLGIRPKDFDIVTSAMPREVEQSFRRRGVTVFDKGESFGVMSVVLGGHEYEIATLRTDGEYLDGRRPSSVRLLGDVAREEAVRMDQQRRDLTINALITDPIARIDYDFVGGRQDIARRVIRAVGDPNQRIAEDRLRMMRAARFAAKLGDFTLDRELLQALKNHAAEIQSVSQERIRDEIRNILVAREPVRGLQILMNTGLMREVLPEVYRLRGPRGRQDPIWHPEGTVWTHTKLVLNNLRGSSFERMMAGLLHDVGKPDTQVIYQDGRISNHGHDEVGSRMVQSIGTRLKMTNRQIAAVSDLVRLHMTMHAVEEMRTGKLRALLERPDILDLIALQHADSTGTLFPERASRSRRDFLMRKLDELIHSPVPTQRLGARPLVTGDILNNMDFRPGPSYRRILNSALSAQHQGEFSTPEAGRVWVLENFGDLRGLSHNQQLAIEAQAPPQQ